MNKQVLFFGLLLWFSQAAFPQVHSTAALSRPKLVVGIMVDQMRWDYLYRFYDRFGDNGFKRLMLQGTRCDNTMVPYAQTVTAAGHTCVYTGSVPAVHGIMGNEWYERSIGKTVYCVDDSTVKLVGVDKGQPMSPANLWTTSICDELRLATNFRGKVIGVAIKDRGSILPAGHAANAAYWYDGESGKWISSTYYMQALPDWVNRFNAADKVDSFYKQDWKTLYPLSTYVQSDRDDVPYEGRFRGEPGSAFPHILNTAIGKDYGRIRSTPYGNTLTLQFAESALQSEQLGADAITDFLAISLSSPDYIGHQFGPNSVEVEDNYLRLDRDLAAFFQYLDRKVGKGQYLVFLTADHAVAHVPGFLELHKIPGKVLSPQLGGLEKELEEKFHVPHAIVDVQNYQIYLNRPAIRAAGADFDAITRYIVEALNQQPDVLLAFDNRSISTVNLPASVKEQFINGYNTKRGGDIQVVLKSGDFYGGKTGTTHGSWYPYDAHIPLLWYGWHISPGATVNRQVHMTDIAPTLATLLHIQMPSGCIGQPITEITH